MKNYLAGYSSENNLFTGMRLIKAVDLPHAQSQFFQWLSCQPVYSHMWQISVRFETVDTLEDDAQSKENGNV